MLVAYYSSAYLSDEHVNKMRGIPVEGKFMLHWTIIEELCEFFKRVVIKHNQETYFRLQKKLPLPMAVTSF